jgi:hypothetical protein
VLELIKNPKRQLVQRLKPLVPQLNKLIAKFIYEVYTAVPDDFLEPAAADPSELLDFELHDDLEPMQQDLQNGGDDWDDLFAPLNPAPTSSSKS